MENKIAVTVTGSNRVELVKNLRAFADNLDGTPAETTGKVKPSPKKQAALEADIDDSDFKPDVGNGFDDDEETMSADAAFDEEEPPPPSKKNPKGASKSKKITIDDVNDVCKAHAQVHGRDATLAVLQKKFKTKTVTALKPEQYEACITAMSVN